MSWWQRFWQSFTRRVPGLRRRGDWDGFKEVDDIRVDTPDEFRDRNNV